MRVRPWEIREVKGYYVIVPVEQWICPICSNEFVLHDFFPHHQRTWSFYHCDVHLKCRYCGFWATFGVPISREEFDVLHRSPLARRPLRWELKDIIAPELYRRIEERLARWGYW